MAFLRVTLFGGFQILCNGQTVILPYDKVRALLAYLLVESRYPHRRETLAGLLWPEQTEKEARHSLSQALLKLKQAIDPENTVVLADRQSVQINPDFLTQVDTAEFVEIREQCLAHRHVQPLLCEACMARREAAVELYKGPFLAGVSLADAAPFEQWLTQQQAFFHHKMMDELAKLAVYHEKRGELAPAITISQRQLALEPWLEETHVQLMRLYLHQGQRSRAIDQYLSCVHILEEELGVEPSSTTKRFFQLLQTADPIPPHNLPQFANPLVGRHSEIAQITSWLANSNGRLITILGPGGMGKSRLALGVAEKQLGRPIADHADHKGQINTYAFFTHGVYWIALSGLKSSKTLIPAIAEAVGLQLESGEGENRLRPPKRQLLDFLREKRLLLVLDNFEDLIESHEAATSTGVIQEILKHARHVHLLVTSRERLQLPEEQLFWLEGLPYPEEGEQEPTGYASVALFLQIAKRLHTQTGFQDEDTAVIAKICRLLQGTPLAIELAANAVSYQSLVDIYRALQGSLAMLESGNRHIPARHRSMDAAFATSWRRLPEDMQHIYAKLSLFQKGFTLEAAQQVARAGIPSLSLLINRSLLQFDHELQRYQIHELMRQLSAVKLAQLEVGVQEGVLARYAAYYLAWIGEQEIALKGADQMRAIKQLDAEFENGRLAWEWACIHQPELIAEAIHPLCLYLDQRGRHLEGVDLCRLALNVWQKNEGFYSNAQQMMGRLWAWTGRFLTFLNRWQEGQLALEQGLATIESEGDRAFALLNYSRILWRADKNEAQALVHQGLGLATTVNDQWTVAYGQNLLGRMTRSLGQFAVADHHLAKSLTIRQKINDQSGIAHTLSHLSLVMMDLGNLDEARSYADQSLSIFQEMKEDLNTANALNSIGLIKSFSGQFEESVTDFARSEAIFNRLGLKFSIEFSSGYSIFSKLFHRGSQAEFTPAFISSFELFRQAKIRRGMAYFALGVALNGLGLGEMELAYRYGADGSQIFESLGQKKEAAECSGLQAAAAQDNKFDKEVSRHLVTYGDFLLESRTFFPTVITMSLMILNGLRQNDFEQALTLHTILMSVPFYANSGWFQDVFGKPVISAAETLPPDVVPKAIENGRKQEFWEASVSVIKSFTSK